MMKRLSLALLAAPTLVACGDDAETTTGVPDNANAAIANYAAIVHASYQDSITAATDLDTKVAAFIAEPSAATLTAARQAWLAAREPYLQTEVYRFYDGPIDGVDFGELEGLINAWPMDENYVDYVDGDATAGIVNDTSVTLTAEDLAELNAAGGDANIATGWHAIEFLLWGQDKSDTGPGDRPFTDYTTADNADRRKTYLTIVSQQLVDLLGEVDSEWNDTGAYRASFLAASPKEGLRRILTGMVTLSGFETGGERLQAALDSKSQEDEHSCFSDNTHRDMIQDIQGVRNVWRGEYTKLDGSKVSGTGIRDVVAQLDVALRDELDLKIDASLALANALQTPFDQELATEAGNTRIRALIVSLQEQATLLEQVFTKLQLEIPQPE